MGEGSQENEFLFKIGIRRITGTLRIPTFILLESVSPRDIISQIIQEKERSSLLVRSSKNVDNSYCIASFPDDALPQ